MTDHGRVIIFSTVWPEPDSSAAGVRQMQWIRVFLARGHRITLISPAKPKGENDWGRTVFPDGVELLPFPLNDSRIRERLHELNPSIVLFDRFLLEEQYGHFVYDCCPDALVLLETQDLHFLRRARQGGEDLRSETALRETASILRTDYSFLVSAYEEKLLKEEFGIGAEKQRWIPFSYETPLLPCASAPYADRRDFMWIGNFRHAPNVDGLRWFRQEIWPRVRRETGATVHVYGAYPSEEVMGWNARDSGFRVHGHAEDLDAVFSSARVNLAPLRFGAGVKGKILEGWRRGVPVVTTSIGEEGLLPEGELRFGGEVAAGATAFADACIRMYSEEETWIRAQRNACFAITRYFDEAKISAEIGAFLGQLLRKKEEGALPDWNARILRHELLNSHKYFSRWIEEKEKTKR